jgi:small subunit ribosomal protein S3e
MAAKKDQMSKKRLFVKNGLRDAELNEFFTRELADAGYAGVEVRDSPMRTDIIIRATRPQDVLGEKGRRIRELTSLVQKRFKFEDGQVELLAKLVANKALCAEAQAEGIRFKLLSGTAVRRACNGVIKSCMEEGAKGVEVIVSGKLRGARAKAMKFREGYMIKTGFSNRIYVREAVRHVLLRAGVIGVKVRIMLPHDPHGVQGPKAPLADIVTVFTPKDEDVSPVPAKVPAVPSGAAVASGPGASVPPVAAAAPPSAPGMGGF